MVAKDKRGAKGRGGGAGAKPVRRIPKEIAGFKVPKELRRSGDALLAKAASPEGKAMLATGLTMAAAAIAAAAERKGTRPADPAAPGDQGQGGKDPQAMAAAVGQAVDSVVTTLFGRRG